MWKRCRRFVSTSANRLALSTSVSIDKKLLEGYAFPILQQVQWGEQDPFQHLNNAVFIRYLETARISALSQLSRQPGLEADIAKEMRNYMSSKSVGPILKSVQCKFKRPIVFPDTVVLASRFGDIQPDRFTLQHIIISSSQNAIVAEGEGVLVSYDYRKLSKANTPEGVRKAIDLFMNTAQNLTN
jgi:acyl-CoA thioester hydrolase